MLDMATEDQIKKDIKAYMDKYGGPPSSWYVGIASDPKSRLDEHGAKDTWIYRTAESSAAARRVEKYFVDEVGTDGGLGGGDKSTKAVYAYKKKPHTNP